MPEQIEETQFEKDLKAMHYSELRPLLKRLEKEQCFEMCRMVQNEIDERVKHIVIE